MKPNLKQLSKKELFLHIEGLGQKSYRAAQVINWIYKKCASSFDEMTDLAKIFREELKTSARISNLGILNTALSEDGTQKFLFELEDGESVESVLIPNTRGIDSFTLCISSQVGCAMGCTFCVTGMLGLKRNLKSYEIVDQVISVKRFIAQEQAGLSSPGEDKGKTITNIVLMGMGEPLNNFTEVAHALRNIMELMGFSKRRITVSTSGIVPGIKKLADSRLGVNLAVSLNATTDEIRTMIMPVNKKYPIQKLLQACREFPLPPRRRITFEYVLIGNINDSAEDARRLVHLLKGIKSKINLIPYNPAHKSPQDMSDNPLNIKLNKPADSRVSDFQAILGRAGQTVIIRKSMGSDIAAACGQLKAAYK